MCCTRLAENTNLSGCIFATKARIDNRKKLVKQHMPHNIVNFGPPTAEICWRVWGTPPNQRVSRLGFVTAPTSLNGGQQNFAGCLAVFWAGTLLYTFWGSCPLTEFCPVHNSLYVQVLRSPISAGWQRYCTALEQRASAKLRRGTRMELRNCRRWRHLYSARRPSR